VYVHYHPREERDRDSGLAPCPKRDSTTREMPR
jgi:hypothetical protein